MPLTQNSDTAASIRPDQGSFLARNAQRVYGVACGTSNVLLLIGGALADQPWMMRAAEVSLAAQGSNIVLGDRARPASTLTLIASGLVFGRAAFDDHMNLIHPSHLGFGLCKTAGIAVLFYGKPLGQRLAASPGLRLVGRVLAARSGVVAEGLLITGSSMLAFSGVQNLLHGSHAQVIQGAYTVAAMTFFVGGNRVRSMIPQAQTQAKTGGALRETLGSPKPGHRGPACE